MGYLDKLEKFIANEKEKKNLSDNPNITTDYALKMRFSELAKSKTDSRVYSDVLQCEIWLCIDKEAAAQIEQDDPEAICYTLAEVKEILGRNPNLEDLYISARRSRLSTD